MEGLHAAYYCVLPSFNMFHFSLFINYPLMFLNILLKRLFLSTQFFFLLFLNRCFQLNYSPHNLKILYFSSIYVTLFCISFCLFYVIFRFKYSTLSLYSHFLGTLVMIMGKLASKLPLVGSESTTNLTTLVLMRLQTRMIITSYFLTFLLVLVTPTMILKVTIVLC
jgi:hypothetical protein